MYEVHGLSLSHNTTKVIYVAEELGIDYKYTPLSPSKGENKTPEHLARHPLGKLPTLTHDGKHVFESGAICRYLATIEGSPLYPQDAYQRTVVDQWMDFYSIHPGRWLGTLLFERVMRSKFGMGEMKKDVEQEALGFCEQQLGCVNQHLTDHQFLAGDQKSIADLFAFAYLETTEHSGFPLSEYPALNRLYQSIKESDAIQRGRARLQAA